MRVNEIFVSVQGEGYWTGLPAVFLRLQGCNLRCPWCDTSGALDGMGGSEISTTQVLATINAFAPKTVVVTGGEPLMQIGALMALMELDGGQHYWHLETNGTLPIPGNAFSWVTISPKPPDYMIIPTFASELKIVVYEPACLDIALALSNKPGCPWWASIVLQPVDNDEEMTRLCIEFLVNTVKPCKQRFWRLSMQMHKFIGVK